MPQSYDVIRANEVGKLICKALDIEPRCVSRVIVDVDVNGDEPLKIFVAMLGGEKMLNVDWAILKGAPIEVLEKPSQSEGPQ